MICAPYHSAVNVAPIEQFVGALGRPYGRVLAVLVDQQLRGAEDVGVGDHETSFPAWRLSQLRFVPAADRLPSSDLRDGTCSNSLDPSTATLKAPINPAVRRLSWLLHRLGQWLTLVHDQDYKDLGRLALVAVAGSVDQVWRKVPDVAYP